MLKPQLTEFMRRIDKNSVAIIPAARAKQCVRTTPIIAIARILISFISPDLKSRMPSP
jgi:hypothetical protein